MEEKYLQIATDYLDEVLLFDIGNIPHRIFVGGARLFYDHFMHFANFIQVDESAGFELEVSEKRFGFLVHLEY